MGWAENRDQRGDRGWERSRVLDWGFRSRNEETRISRIGVLTVGMLIEGTWFCPEPSETRGSPSRPGDRVRARSGVSPTGIFDPPALSGQRGASVRKRGSIQHRGFGEPNGDLVFPARPWRPRSTRAIMVTRRPPNVTPSRRGTVTAHRPDQRLPPGRSSRPVDNVWFQGPWGILKEDGHIRSEDGMAPVFMPDSGTP